MKFADLGPVWVIVTTGFSNRKKRSFTCWTASDEEPTCAPDVLEAVICNELVLCALSEVWKDVPIVA